MPPRVTMFVQNGITFDNRVLKEARVLRDAGWTVTIVGKQTSDTLAAEEMFEGIRIFRVQGRQRVIGGLTNQFLKVREKLLQQFIYDLKIPPRLPRRVREESTKFISKMTWSLLEAMATGVRNFGVALNKTEPLNYLVDWQMAVDELGDKIKADVWHAHDVETMPCALRMRAAYGGKVIYDSHEYWLDCNNAYSRFEKTTWAALEAITIHGADAVITVSESIADYLAKRYHVKTPAVVLNTPNFHAVVPDKSLRERFKIPKDAFLIIYVGLVTHMRGYEKLIDAISSIDGGILLFLGPGDEKYISGLKEQARMRGVDARVVFAGPVSPDEIQKYTAAADVGVVVGQRGSISYEFALPSKYFEYIFAGLPVATSAFIEMERLTRKYDLGETFDERDPASIAAALIKIRANMQNYQGPSWDERRQELVGQFAWNVHKNVLLDVYSNLISGNTASPVPQGL